MTSAVLDSDTLSEVLKGRDPTVHRQSLAYLTTHGRFTFSIITRYEILRGLMAKQAVRQIQAFNSRCSASDILPMTETVVVKAAEVYGQLHRTGQLISDADILIAATALVNGMDLVTENVSHFGRIPGLNLHSWRVPPNKSAAESFIPYQRLFFKSRQNFFETFSQRMRTSVASC